MPGKRIQFDDETWAAIDLLARDTMKDFQELAQEAFADLLKKHHRPANLAEALRQSARGAPANDPGPPPPRPRKARARRRPR
jgi:predicted transcriptional regulator